MKGSSLIEILLTIVIVSSIVFLLSTFPNAIGLISKSKHLSLAREIASKQIEDARNLKYKDLTNGASAVNDSRLRELPQGNGAVLIENCDPNLCKDNEQLKQITISINWKDNNKEGAVSLKTLIGKEGLSK